MAGYGSSPYGAGAYGGPAASFDIASTAAAVNQESVDITFSSPYLSNAAVLAPGSYNINDISVVGVEIRSATVLRLYTTTQSLGAKYQIDVVGAVVSTTNQALINKKASFTGSGADLVYVPIGLIASSRCEGKQIQLSWTNPTSPAVQHVRIVRRTRAWVYDVFTDPGDVVYDGTAISAYTDYGACLADSSRLLEENTYYYYVVTISNLTNPTRYDNTEACRVMGYSIKVYDNKDILWKHTPRRFRARDLKSVNEGGGGGFLDKWYDVMACGMSLIRGFTDGLQLLTDDDVAPYPTVKARVVNLGIFSPDGENYDFLTARREALGLVHQYQIRGSCEGIVDITKILTLWDCACTDLGTNEVCATRAGNLRTWDGISANYFRSGVQGVITSGYRVFTDAGAAWTPGEWVGGRIKGAMGDIACVADNTTNALTLIQAPMDWVTSDDFLPGGAVHVTDGLGLANGLALEFTDGVNIHISEVNANATAKLITPLSPSLFTFPAGSRVSLGKDSIRAEYVSSRAGNTSTFGSDTVVTAPSARWETNQWKNYYYIDFDNNSKRLIKSNTANTLIVTGTISSSIAQSFAISTDFTVGGSYASRIPFFKYRLSRGRHSTLYAPNNNFAARGTRYDAYNRLYHGPGINLTGAWGPRDVGVFITTPGIRVTYGKTKNILGAVLTLDAGAPALTVNALVGLYLNPNENQSQLFRIVANTTTTITVLGDIGSLGVIGQQYYVLTARDANRYNTLVTRLTRDFTDSDSRPHVFFAA